MFTNQLVSKVSLGGRFKSYVGLGFARGADGDALSVRLLGRIPVSSSALVYSSHSLCPHVVNSTEAPTSL